MLNESKEGGTRLYFKQLLLLSPISEACSNCCAVMMHCVNLPSAVAVANFFHDSFLRLIRFSHISGAFSLYRPEAQCALLDALSPRQNHILLHFSLEASGDGI